MLAVADGMGGHQAGNVASALAIKATEDLWAELNRHSLASIEQRNQVLKDLILQSNITIISEAIKNSSKSGMGTTMTAGLLYGNHLTVGHVGDSRAYVIYDHKIELITRDHSLLEKLLESGEVKPEQAKNHPQRHVLTRAVGIDNNLEVDLYNLELAPGAILVFCTDGLTNQVSDEELKIECLNNINPAQMAENLVKLANDRGGFDNITVAIATGIGG